MKLLSERLRKALDDIGASQAELARACGVRSPSVSDWMSGRTKALKGDSLVRAAAFLGVRADWLADGIGPMKGPADPQPFLRPISVWSDADELPPDQFVFFPKLDHRWSCGPGGPDHSMVEQTDRSLPFTADWAKRKGWSPRTHFTMRATGDSMEPTIQHDAPVVIDTSDTGRIVRSGKVYAILVDGEPLLKRLDKLPGGRLRIRSDNPAPAYAPFEVEEGAIKVVGRAVWSPLQL